MHIRLWCAFVLALVVLLVACNGERDGQPNGGRGGDGTPSAAGSPVKTTAAPFVLARDQRLMLRFRDGTEQTLLRTPPNTFPTFPVWSPNGAQIAFVQSTSFTGAPNADWGGDIYIVNANGGGPRLIWKHDQTGAQIWGLAWTVDGQYLLAGYQLTLIRNNRYEGQVQRLLKIEIASGRQETLIENAILPSLSRDGSRLAYMIQDDTGRGGLFVAHPDGGNPKQVLEIGGQFLAVLGPRISPDGTQIAFAAVVAQAATPAPPPAGGGWLARLPRPWRAMPATAHGFPMDVWIVNVADNSTKQLTNFAEDEPYPAWAPHGRQIYIMATGGFYQMNADGSDLKKIGLGAFDGRVDVKDTIP